MTINKMNWYLLQMYIQKQVHHDDLAISYCKNIKRYTSINVLSHYIVDPESNILIYGFQTEV